jgi:hypothetical protein
MDDVTALVEREQEAYLVLSRIRDAREILPAGHPSAAPLDAAVASAEGYWRELRAAVEAVAPQAAKRDGPDSAWDAR